MEIKAIAFIWSWQGWKNRTMKEILLANRKGVARPQIAHLVFADTHNQPEKTKRAISFLSTKIGVILNISKNNLRRCKIEEIKMNNAELRKTSFKMLLDFNLTTQTFGTMIRVYYKPQEFEYNNLLNLNT